MIFFKSRNQIQSINQARREINHRPTKKHSNTISFILSSTQIGNKLFHHIRVKQITINQSVDQTRPNYHPFHIKQVLIIHI
ncbi:hypothetical protein YC2023_058739 [Brassica napus]